MMTKWIGIKTRIKSIEEMDYDMDNLILNVRRFYNMTIERSNSETSIIDLFEARTYFETCVTIIKSLIDPGDNELIDMVNTSTAFIKDIDIYFDNLLAILDVQQKDIQNEIKQVNAKLVDAFYIKLAIKGFREKIVDYMNNLILMPFMNSLNNYKKYESIIKTGRIKIGEDEYEITKKKIFEYILFTEIFKSAKLKGSPVRQKVSASSGLSSSFHETNIIKPGKSKPMETISQADNPPELQEEFPSIIDFEDNF